jgi:hypothetical protein
MKLFRSMRRTAGPLTALTIVLALYGLARPPALPAPEAEAMTARYRFGTAVLSPPAVARPINEIRPVHPSLDGIVSWISSVGAAIALHDLDLDGLPNDLCVVDTRNNEVSVMPAPGTGDRYTPFVLDLGPAGSAPETKAPMGCAPGDFNGDGRPDLLVYYWGRMPTLHLAVPGAGPPSPAGYRVQLVLDGEERWYTNAVAVADLNGDGNLDLVIGNYFQDDARILDAGAVGGQEEMQRSMSRAANGGRNRLLLWSGTTLGAPPGVRYREAGEALPADARTGWTLAVAAADLDGDGLPELYFANDFGPDRLLHNRSAAGRLDFAVVEGHRGFRTPASKVVGRDSFKGMGADFADLDGDGILDLFVSNIAEAYALHESHFAFIGTGGGLAEGQAPFIDRSESLGLSRSGWGWDAKAADFDNDARPEVVQALGFTVGDINRWPELQELAMANDELVKDPRVWFRMAPGDALSGDRNLAFFAPDGNGVFHDLAAKVGLLAPQGSLVSRGVAIADVDGDGGLDLALANQWAAPTMHRNLSPGRGRFLGITALLAADLRQPGVLVRPGHPPPGEPQRPAIGLTAVLTLPDGSRRVAQVDGGSGHSGKRAPQIHFGLGATPADADLHVSLRWRGAEGRLYEHAVTLRPGWHTLFLGNPIQVAEDLP